MIIKTVSDFRRAMRQGAYAWPGGYPLYFVMSDGEACSIKGAKLSVREMLEALVDSDMQSEWKPVALEVNWDDPALFCAHTNERIESAYAEEAVNGLQVSTVTLPEHWASALVNGDMSGLEDEDISALEAWQKRNPDMEVVDVARDTEGNGQEPRFTWSYRLYEGNASGGSVLDYVVHVRS